MVSLKEVPKQIYDLYSKTASDVITYLEGEDQKRYLKAFMSTIETNCKLDVKLKRSQEIFESFSNGDNEANSDDGSDTDEKNTAEQFRDAIATIDDDVSHHKKYLEYKQQIQTLLDNEARSKGNCSEDSELVLTQDTINIFDPITKKRMTDPVRNTTCGHVYDRNSITALLKANKKTRCPIAGCKTKGYVSLGNLQVDIITKNYLDRNPES